MTKVISVACWSRALLLSKYCLFSHYPTFIFMLAIMSYPTLIFMLAIMS